MKNATADLFASATYPDNTIPKKVTTIALGVNL